MVFPAKGYSSLDFVLSCAAAPLDSHGQCCGLFSNGTTVENLSTLIECPSHICHLDFDMRQLLNNLGAGGLMEIRSRNLSWWLAVDLYVHLVDAS